MNKEAKIFSSERNLIVLNDGDYYFLVDIVYTGGLEENRKYMCRGEDVDKNIRTDWVVIKDPNPAHKFANYLEHLVEELVK